MTTIEWTQRPGTKGETWNPIAAFDKETGKRGWFCEKVSPGCTHCYAETFNVFRGNGQLYRVGNRDKVDIRLEGVTRPLHWKKPRTVFVCSMTDLFHELHTDEMIDTVFAVMALAPQHVFQVLTKRPERMREYINYDGRAGSIAAESGKGSDGTGTLPFIRPDDLAATWPLPNVWLGTSVENQEMADERIPQLLDTPAAVRFLSCEPLLGFVDLTKEKDPIRSWLRGGVRKMRGVLTNEWRPSLDWVIVGGESGAGARVVDVDWIRSIVYQCKSNGVAVFVKQLGREPGEYYDNPELAGKPGILYHHYDEPSKLYIKRLKDRKGGDISEFPEELRVREYPEVAA